MYIASEHTAHFTRKHAPSDGANCLRDLFSKQPVEHRSGNRSLFLEGDEAAHVFQVVEGTLRIFKIISDGRRVITGFLYAGDIVGISLGKRYLYSADAVSSTTVRRLTRNQFDSGIDESPRLRTEVSALVSDEMAAAQDQMVLLSCKSAEERMCSFLLKLLKKSELLGERRLSIELPMSRQDIADYLGLTIETVSRTITKLINKRVLRIENAVARHSISVERPVLLAQLAGDDDDCSDMRHDLVVQGSQRRH
ncbi:CRP/FNR family transcriptional regulator [Neorhizobium galegae]|uniref:Crp/Fnr family transcriptional regulator n=1 Tax=Neorhizobium galegae TaxID=399 RepID=UPI001AEB863E|nr:helix-turn-helix domain-containing protein [Neorhizobium galegae]MBP2562368.1 CRP/FNR family transcriptional regulator [Neorhizobium galegae]MDQ0138164.1 CRP/FNR family transcriptional regulator [Neorhizobium galegae]